MPIMSNEWQVQNQENKKRWFLGNTEAINFINTLFYAVELWDDLIDKDVEISDNRINEVFAGLMVALPGNEWFIKHRFHYFPIIIQSINGFHDANNLAKSQDKKLRNLAFHIRNMGTEIHIATAYLIGGYEYMRKVSGEIREFFAFEQFEEWDKENA